MNSRSVPSGAGGLAPEGLQPGGLTVPNVTGLDLTTAALLYAEAGWFVLPVRLRTKHPGSILGTGWPAKTSRDPAQIESWFAAANRGLALHIGRSGAVTFDVDRPQDLPELLAQCLSAAGQPFQSTRASVPTRGHHVFAQPQGVDLGNGRGSLQGSWGDVRGRNGVIVVEPSMHTNHELGGQYLWTRHGRLPLLPPELLYALQAGRGPTASRRGSMYRARPPGRRRSRRPTSLEEIVQRILDADERNNAVFEGACRIGELVASGRLSVELGTEILVRAGRAVGLHDIELLGLDGRSGTIQSGLATGAAAARLWAP